MSISPSRTNALTLPRVGVGKTSLQVGTYAPGHEYHILLAQKALERELCDLVILAVKPDSTTKANLPAPHIRINMLELLIKELAQPHEQGKILVALFPTPYEDQLALTRTLGNPKDTHIRELTGSDSFEPYIGELDPKSRDIKEIHHDVFIRHGYDDAFTPRFTEKLEQLGVSYKTHPCHEEKPLSSSKIRDSLSTLIKNPKDFEALNALKEIYKGAPKALDFLIEHAKEFTKLVKR